MRKSNPSQSLSQLTVSDKSASKLVITAYALSCSSGTHPANLLSAMYNKTYTPSLDADLFFSGNKNQSTLESYAAAANSKPKNLPPFYAAPIQYLSKLRLAERIEVMLKCALSELEIKLSSTLPQDSLRFHFLLPKTSSPRYCQVNSQTITALVHRHAPRFAPTTITFSHSNENHTTLLSQLQTELQQGKWNGIILGSVDSLIDELTCQTLYKQNFLQTIDQDYGVIPGEGAVLVLLQTQPALPVLASINSIFSISMASNVHREASLITAIQQACSLINLMPSDIEAILLSYGKQATDPLSWYEVTQAIWPFHSKQNSVLAEEWNTHYTFGDLGAAEFPLHLILACERLHYPFPSIKHLLVMQTNRSTHSAVICSL